MTTKMMLLGMLGSLFMLFITFPAFSQAAAEISPERRGSRAINALKEGVLIIRLESNHNKIKKMEELAGSKEVDSTTRRRLQRQAAEEREITKRNNMKLTYAFFHHYRFSDVLFMYDKNARELKSGTQSGIFLNKDLEPASEINLEGRPFLILYTGIADQSSTTGVESYLVMDQDFKTLEKPFPYYLPIKNMGSFFDGFLGSKTISKKSAYKVALKFNKRFENFYQRYGR